MVTQFSVVIILIFLIIAFIYFLEPILTKQKIKDNKEHGSARWATIKEIKQNFREEKISNINESGFPIYFSKDNKNVWFDNKTPHWICLGSTGSGKSVTSVIPYCSFIATAKNKKSVFITDPKAEILNTTSQMFKDNGYNVLCIDFRNPEYSNHINLLEPIITEYELYYKYLKLSEKEKKESKYIEYKNKSIIHYARCNQLVSDISSMIMNDTTAKEKFWNNSSSDLLYGLIFLFLEDYVNGKIKREQITLTSIKKFQSSSMSDVNNKKIKKYIGGKTYDMKSKDKLFSLLNTSETTYRSITSTFSERMSLYDDINVENISSNSDFNFDDLGKKPTVLYCCVPDESQTYYTLISIIVSLIYKTLVILCNEQKDKKLPCEIVFLLDEFGNTPPLKDIKSMVSVGRSRGLYFVFYLQSIQQLDDLYGKETSQIVQDNCGLQFLKTNSQDTAEQISNRLGTHGVETTSLNYSMSLTNNNGSKGMSLISRKLMTADEIKQLVYKTIIFSSIGYPIIRDTILYSKFSCYQSGCIKRKKRPLQRFSDRYYTVDQIELEEKSNDSKINTLESQIRNTLINIINNVLKIFGKIDFDVEYENIKNSIIAKLYLAPPLSINEIKSLEDLSNQLKFNYNIITDKEKICKKNKNSLIEIFLFDK